MENNYKTAIFKEKSTGKQLYRLHVKPLNKFFWEKEKAIVLDKISRERFLHKDEILIEE